MEADVRKAVEVIASDELLDALYFNKLLVSMMEATWRGSATMPPTWRR